jgi:guanine deaminase
LANKKFMDLACKEALRGMNNNEGGPFGAVIVKDGEVIAKAHNRVIKTNDPTAHAEIVAIRKASKKLGRFDLSDCQIYSTCEPCPMCLAAIHWAKMKTLYYGCTKKDAASINFDDKFIYDVIKEVAKKPQVEKFQVERDACLRLFTAWKEKDDKVPY